MSEQFAWRHFYWYLTNEGISYLRNYLHLPAEVSPSFVMHLKNVEVTKDNITSICNKMVCY